MEQLNLWCKIVSSVSVISAVFMLVVPESKIKKAFKTLLTLILLFSLLFPFKTGDIVLSSFADKITSFHANNYKAEINDYKDIAVIYASQTEIENYLTETFSVSGIDCDCRVICDYDGEKIHIVKIEIEGDLSDEEKKFMCFKINEISDEETEVIFNGEQYG